jgi:peptide/nickel transport system ATP-binding protein
VTVSPDLIATADEDPGAVAGLPPGRLKVTLRRFARNRGALAGAVVLAALFVLAFGGPLIARSAYSDIDYSALYEGPSAAHWFGTDAIGHDVFAQTVRGLQKSLLIGLLVALFSTALASVVGAAAGYFGGWVDRGLMLLVDLLLVFPSFLIIAIVAPRLRGGGWIALVAVIAAFFWMVTARVIRSMTLSLKQREFVRAAQLMGVGPARIIARHILPNVASFLIIDATINVGVAVMSETALSFFGFGVQPPDVSLGTLIATGTNAALSYPWMFFFPAGLLIVLVLAVNLMGDGLRDAFDPTAAPGRARAVPPARLPADDQTTASDQTTADDHTAPSDQTTAGDQVTVRPVRDRAAAADKASGDIDATTGTGTDTVLRVRDLVVSFPGKAGPIPAVRGVGFDLRRGEVLGIVGESGSGKSVTALAAMGLLPASASVRGSVRLDGTELVGASDRDLARLRGNRIGMVFQDPLSAFTPVYSIGAQIIETIRTHQTISGAAARTRAIELLDLVGIPDPHRRVDAFPHEFSGGMRQRAMIAAAIAGDPEVILADEPTTALDVTVQAQVLDVLRTARRETGAALVFVSHDLGVVAGFADRVAVMYAGRIVETAPVDDLFDRPRMPYTLGLIGAVPRLDGPAGRPLVPITGTPPAMAALTAGCPFAPRCPIADDRCATVEPELSGDGHLAACLKTGEIAGAAPEDVYAVPEVPPAAPLIGDTIGGRETLPPVLRVDGLVKTFPLLKGAVFKRRTGSVHAVDGVDLDIRRGETLGLVGESGSGKSTTLLEVLGLRAPEAGTISLLGKPVSGLSPAAERDLRSQVQIVFQDPMASLDPRMPVGDIIAEPLGARHPSRAAELLTLVGLEPAHATRFPHEFSGGQRQRIAIARALATGPRLLVLDEPVSALDVSIQAGILNLLARLKAELGLAYLLVSHDLAVVRHIADRVSVMYLGRTVETGTSDAVFGTPLHPYTRALLAAVPLPDPRRERARARTLLAGDPPSPTEKLAGCRFRARCPVYAALGAAERARCETESPAPAPRGVDHVVACHYPPDARS